MDICTVQNDVSSIMQNTRTKKNKNQNITGAYNNKHVIMN